ncbi:NXPE family member 3-like [Hoplias malabaricus]|uniref:NXPE family member 3-like n=1 Tax=Hoplias malabaricus TaxID=27720 RepID=UPI00346214E0
MYKLQCKVIIGIVSILFCCYFWPRLLGTKMNNACNPDTTFSRLMNSNDKNLSTPTPTSQFPNIFISAEELQSIEKALRWQAPPTAVTSVNQATSPYKSSYTLQNPQENYSVGDVITVLITARDGQGNLKTHGGDFFQTRLFNDELKASVFGEVVDHGNGTYTAIFKLLWAGQAKVAVRMIHSSESVEVILKHREQEPDKVYFVGVFKGNGQQEKMVCNVQRSVRLLTSPCCCEYKNPITGELWLCRKPQNLPCSAWVDHDMGGYQAQLTALESNLLHSNFSNVYLPGAITVLVSPRDLALGTNLTCVPGLHTPSPAGFYLNDRWTSLMCNVQPFRSAQQIAACLKDKQILMMGDSTLRQWYEYLLETVPTLKPLNLFTSSKSGPFEAVEIENNIRMVWRAHGLPLRTSLTPKADLHYIANELDTLAGGPHSVVVFTIWAHFTTYPLTTYLKRLSGIRSSILALLQRAPQTLVLIKSANTGYKDVYGSDWLSWQLDCAMRKMFEELPVVIVDVWQMTSCHYSPDDIHPPRVVIQNEVDIFLSFVCPR